MKTKEMLTDEQIEIALKESVKKGYIRCVGNGQYKMTKKGQGYVEGMMRQLED